MKLYSTILLLFGFTYAYSQIYVAPDGTGDGTSWTQATTLLDALSIASSGDEIWVKQGTYFPANSRDSSFVMKDGISLYGGFLGNETSISSRSGGTSLLSGDIGIPGDNSDNNYHVIYSEANNVLIDGFTISHGNTSTAFGNDDGGGLYNTGINFIISNCIFSQNVAHSSGGGVRNTGYNMTIINSLFTKNNSNSSGGGISNIGANISISNCRFTENSAYSGGGLRSFANNVTITNCNFSENSAENDGGGASIFLFDHKIVNCTFTKNTAEAMGGAIFYSAFDTYILNCTFFNNSEMSKGFEQSCTSSLEIYNCILLDEVEFCSSTILSNEFNLLYDGEASENNLNANDIDPNDLFSDPDNGDFTLKSGSPAINAGNNAHYDLSVSSTDLAGKPRIQNGTIDLGAFEFRESPICDPGKFAKNVIPESCPGTSDGEIRIGRGALPSGVRLQWDDGIDNDWTRENLSAGTYVATFYHPDNKCIQYTESFVVDVPEIDPISVLFQDQNLCEVGDMIVSLDLPNPDLYVFAWSTGETTPQITGLDTGHYAVSIWHKSGCFEEQADSFIVEEIDGLTLEVSHDPFFCQDAQITNLVALPSGGDGNYNISWSDGHTGATHPDHSNKIDLYVYVQDGNGCLASKKVNQDINLMGLVLRRGDDWIQTQVNGGTGPHTFSWNDGVVGSYRTNMAPGVYSLTITDANDCSRTWHIRMGSTSSPNRSHTIRGWIEGIDTEVNATRNEQFEIYPTITKDLVNLSASFRDINRIAIYNINGQLVQETLPTGSNQVKALRLGSLPSGVYVVQIHTTNDVLTKRVKKQ